MSKWLYEGSTLDAPPSSAVGFVYMITNLITDKKYIGRKYLHKTRRVKQKGKARRKVVRTESNWEEYTGSNKFLNADIDAHGIQNFKFEILCFGETRGQVNYLEENYQHKFNVLLRDDFYNDSIGNRKFLTVKFPEHLKSSILNESIDLDH